MNVVVLAGGVGGARFLLGVKKALGLDGGEPAEHQVTAVVNTGDDIWLHGLRICPDLDTCMYTLGGGIDGERGWGRAQETWTVRDELRAYGAEPTWFGLGDRDLATHLVRSRMLRAGYPLSAVTEALCTRWQPGVILLPATDDRLETHVVVSDENTGRRAIHFQEWWVRYHAELPAQEFVPIGADQATPAPGVLGAIAAADAVLIAPSNPVVSVGSILAVPGIRAALRQGPARVVGLSPIVAGRPLRGMAAECLAAIGVASTAEAVGRYYGARSDRDTADTADTADTGDTGDTGGTGGTGGLLDGWLVHTGDTAEVPGVQVRAVPLLMSSVDATADMARAALELAGVSVAV